MTIKKKVLLQEKREVQGLRKIWKSYLVIIIDLLSAKYSTNIVDLLLFIMLIIIFEKRF